MNLRDMAESISVEHNNFIDKKHNLYNNLLFKNYYINYDNFIEKKEIGYLNFETITKKSCIYKPPENNNLDFINNNILDIKTINFNINTRAKTSN